MLFEELSELAGQRNAIDGRIVEIAAELERDELCGATGARSVAALVAWKTGTSPNNAHTIVTVAETEGAHVPPEPLWPTILLSVPVLAILGLVLAKPELGEIPMPGWLSEPRGVQLPFDVPRR